MLVEFWNVDAAGARAAAMPMSVVDISSHLATDWGSVISAGRWHRFPRLAALPPRGGSVAWEHRVPCFARQGRTQRTSVEERAVVDARHRGRAPLLAPGWVHLGRTTQRVLSRGEPQR